jgi:hypothetical protein
LLTHDLDRFVLDDDLHVIDPSDHNTREGVCKLFESLGWRWGGESMYEGSASRIVYVKTTPMDAQLPMEQVDEYSSVHFYFDRIGSDGHPALRGYHISRPLLFDNRRRNRQRYHTTKETGVMYLPASVSEIERWLKRQAWPIA